MDDVHSIPTLLEHQTHVTCQIGFNLYFVTGVQVQTTCSTILPSSPKSIATEWLNILFSDVWIRKIGRIALRVLESSCILQLPRAKAILHRLFLLNDMLESATLTSYMH